MDTILSYKPRRKPKPNLFPPPTYCRLHENLDPKSFEERYKFPKLNLSDPGKVLRLCESLTGHRSQDLEQKVNIYLNDELEAETVFLITFLSENEVAIVQVVGNEVLDTDVRVSIPEDLNERIKKNCKLNETYKNKLEYLLQSIVTNTLEKVFDKNKPPKSVVIVPAFSFQRSSGHRFTQFVCVVNSPKMRDVIEKMVQETFRFCQGILFNTSKFEQELYIKKQCQAVLRVARQLFGRLDNLNELLKKIMTEAKHLTNAERCSLFLLDPERKNLVAQVFDGVEGDKVVSISKDQGIAGLVLATGELLNIDDAYSHPLFYEGLDEVTGFQTRNMLCFPIRDEEGIIGVAELCNKITGDRFDYFDEEVALAFSVYCGLSIVHSMMYEKLLNSQQRVALSNELMLYHMKVSNEDVLHVLQCPNKHVACGYNEFYFSSRTIRHSETICYLLRMYEDLGLVKNFNIKRQHLITFLLYVQRSYRDLSYHCWDHAFNTAHFAFLLIQKLSLVEKGYLSKLETLAYLTSCICHDIDHRGTTNAHLAISGSPLAILHSSQGSILERHHFSQTICILNTDNCNFLDNLESGAYRQCLDLIKQNILATDIALHLKNHAAQKKMCEEGYSKMNPDHKNLLLSLLMTWADLSDQTKGWHVAKLVAKLVLGEFFAQGDREKEMGIGLDHNDIGASLMSELFVGIPVAPMMDRSQADISQMQVEFLKTVIIPLYTMLRALFPQTESLLERIHLTMQCWAACKPFLDNERKQNVHTMEVLESEDVKKVVHEILGPAGSTIELQKSRESNESEPTQGDIS